MIGSHRCTKASTKSLLKLNKCHESGNMTTLNFNHRRDYHSLPRQSSLCPPHHLYNRRESGILDREGHSCKVTDLGQWVGARDIHAHLLLQTQSHFHAVPGFQVKVCLNAGGPILLRPSSFPPSRPSFPPQLTSQHVIW